MKISQTLIYVSLIYICHTALHVNHKMPCSNYSDICLFYHSNYCALNFIFVSALVTYVLLTLRVDTHAEVCQLLKHIACGYS